MFIVWLYFNDSQLIWNSLTKVTPNTDRPPHTTHTWPRWNFRDQVPRSPRCPGAEIIWGDRNMNNFQQFGGGCSGRGAGRPRLLINFIGTWAALLCAGAWWRCVSAAACGVSALCGDSHSHLLSPDLKSAGLVLKIQIVANISNNITARNCTDIWYQIHSSLLYISQSINHYCFLKLKVNILINFLNPDHHQKSNQFGGIMINLDTILEIPS